MIWKSQHALVVCFIDYTHSMIVIFSRKIVTCEPF